MLGKVSEFKKLPNTVFPDLKNPKMDVGVKVKATTRAPWSTVGPTLYLAGFSQLTLSRSSLR